MQILFLAHRIPYPPNKGDKIRSFWELKTLSERHQVDLFCFYDDAEDRDSIVEVRRYCRNCYAEPLSFLRARMQAASTVQKGAIHDLLFPFSANGAPSRERVAGEKVRPNFCV